jgi:hypothetical protein
MSREHGHKADGMEANRIGRRELIASAALASAAITAGAQDRDYGKQGRRFDIRTRRRGY